MGDDWRTRIPEQLAALAEAWRNPAAWQGMTQAGGVDLPADMAGNVALTELVVHGWDVAPQGRHPEALEPCLAPGANQGSPGCPARLLRPSIQA